MIKFGCCIILKKEPFHIMCIGEKDAAPIIEREKDNVVLVLFSKTGIERKFVERKLDFVSVPQKLIETREVHDINNIPEEVIEESREKLRKKFASEVK